MHFQYTPYIFPLLAAAAISAWMAVTILSRRSGTSLALAGLALGMVVWTLGYALEIAGADLATKVIWGKVQYIGIAGVPFAWLVFAYNHTHPGRQLAWRTLLLLAIVPLITVGLVFTTQVHGLVWKETHIINAGAFSVLGVSYGIWFWVHSIYSYLFLLIGAISIFRSMGHKQGLYRGQTLLLFIAVLAPWLGNAVYLSGLGPIPHLDLTPFAFTVSVLAITWAVYGFRLIDLTPLARDMVVEGMGDGMIVIDAHDRISDINSPALQLFDISAGQTIGGKIDEILIRWPYLLERIRGKMETLDEIMLGEGEAERLFEIRISPLSDRRKHLLGRVITFRDITDRKRTDEQLRQLSRAVEASPTSIVITDTQARIQYVNPKFCEVTGYSREEAYGQNPRILKTDQTPAEVHRQLWTTITAGREWRGEFCNRKKNGEIYWESASISPIFDAAGKIVFFVAVKEDITGRKKVDKELASVRDQALETSRMKSQLLAKVSQELRTPLAGLLGFANVLQSTALPGMDKDQKRALTQIIERSHYLNTLVDELLDESELEARTVRLRQESVSPAAILRKVEISMAMPARNKALSFGTIISTNTPERVQGDDRRLQQILTNLVANAIKYTKSGEVTMRTFSPDPEHWAMQVTDTGPGFSPGEQASIFEPFRQVVNTTTYDNRGTGLGLSITKQLVDLMGGQITVESEAGQGSTFTVILPVRMIEEGVH